MIPPRSLIIRAAGRSWMMCRFTKSVIRSKAALSYAEAQTRMDDERLHDEITVGLRQLNSLAKIMRARRFERRCSGPGFSRGQI